jgi:divalent metal cation (Fe/Co/Zn/Cd) transporter
LGWTRPTPPRRKAAGCAEARAHARADAYVPLAVVASAVVVALGVPVADPLVGLTITAVILRIAWDSWRTVRHGDHHHHA